jgi:D-alanyl-lipoteichoic acid acyltransferase DltB (MBOAT superfamily)
VQLLLATAGGALSAFVDAVLGPIGAAPWSDWRGWWIGTLLDERYVVVYALVLAAPLLLLSGRALRAAVPASGAAFLVYVAGAFYAAAWLILCLLIYRAGECFARAVGRGPWQARRAAAAAIVLLGAAYFASFRLVDVRLPVPLNEWLWSYAPWLFPLGLRGVSWEPDWIATLRGGAVAGAPQLFAAVFRQPHDIGLTFLGIRTLHYFCELYRGALPRAARSPLRFLAYTCYAPALIQGPIEPYRSFHSELETCHQRRRGREVGPALARMGLGLLKSMISTLYFEPFFVAHLKGGDYYARPELVESWALLYFGVYLHIFQLYLEFSGYCDISAGFARLLGYRQIENFRWPWLATSMRDFWRRWHISLSLRMRDDVYIPLGGSRERHLLNLMATFALIGVWHAPRFQLALWGVLMGLMVFVNHQWAAAMERLDAGRGGPLAGLRRVWLRLRPLPQICAWAVTMHCFVHSLLLFFGGGAIRRVTWELLRRLFT